MAANPVLPEAGIHKVQAINTQDREEKDLDLKQRLTHLLYKVFSGHEDFLGWTPD
jgi:hypothetical protein